MSKMKRSKFIWLIVGTSLTLAGALIFVGGMTLKKWNFIALATNAYETNTYEITEPYTDISVITDTADVTFLPSTDGKHSVVCYEQSNTKHSVSVKDGTLVISLEDTRKWYEHIGIDFSSEKITVCLPTGDYGALTVNADTSDIDLPKELGLDSIDITLSTGDVKCHASVSGNIKIKTSTGAIDLKEISADSIDIVTSTGTVNASDVSCKKDVSIAVSTGKSCLNNITCASLLSVGDTGDLHLTGVIASEKFSIERDTGDVSLDGCDAAELFVKTSTGDVFGSLLSDKIFITNTSTGDIRIPSSTTGGKCEIRTSTGDIKISISE